MPFDKTATFVGRTMAMPKSNHLGIENKDENERFAYSPNLSGRCKIFVGSDSKTNPLFDETETLEVQNTGEKDSNEDERNFDTSLTTVNSNTQKDLEKELLNDKDSAIINDVSAIMVHVNIKEAVLCFQDAEKSTKIAKENSLKGLNLFSNTYCTERAIKSKNHKLILIFWMLLLEADLPHDFYESLQKSDTFMTFTSKFFSKLEIMTLKALID